jgi:hypothetical protein
LPEVTGLRELGELDADDEGGGDAFATGSVVLPVDPTGRVATTAVPPRSRAMPTLSSVMSILRFMDSPRRPQA